jgi:dTDP-4-amino-4,6-dideoxygalactose transaminase
MINVTQTYLPPFEDYVAVLKRAWDKQWITNNGELLLELESKLKNHLEVDHLLYCSNGTIVLQMALKVLGITKEVITTPFSYVATTNSILWEGCTPVFVDIDPLTFTIDPDKIETAITENTEAILATHVYGYPCNIEKIEVLAKRFNLKVIYDAAHAFGCLYKGKSLLSYGDLSTCSFHATKIFHTVEGGSIICHDKETAKLLFLFRSFGHIDNDYYCTGINAKNSEFHAAMGLAVLPYQKDIVGSRKEISSVYDRILGDVLQRPSMPDDFIYNYSYYPVVFKSEDELLLIKQSLEAKKINTRRYFYPSLNNLPQTSHLRSFCPISEDISKRILCLPLYAGLSESNAIFIADSIVKILIANKVPV